MEGDALGNDGGVRLTSVSTDFAMVLIHLILEIT
jgi:hypothetical protein